MNQLQDQVRRRIVAEEGLRDPATMSRRDILDYMEKIGVIASADAFLDVVRARNPCRTSIRPIRNDRPGS